MSNSTDEDIKLDVLPKEPERVLEVLNEGKMVVARSKNDFLYIIDFDRTFHMFSHTVGAPGGGQRQFPKNEKYTAAVRKIAGLADALFVVEYDRELNIYGVMSTAEDAVLSMFPGEDRGGDEVVEFKPWDRDKDDREVEESVNGAQSADPFGYFNPNLDENE